MSEDKLKDKVPKGFIKLADDDPRKHATYECFMCGTNFKLLPNQSYLVEEESDEGSADVQTCPDCMLYTYGTFYSLEDAPDWLIEYANKPTT